VDGASPDLQELDFWLRNAMNLRGSIKLGAPPVIAAIILVSMLAVPLSAVAAANVLMAVRPADLPQPQPKSQAQTTQIFGADGSVLAEWHGEIDRQPVPLPLISKYFQDAVIAAEDARYFERGAADIWAILRALWVNVTHGAWVQGGSTIAQQYAKEAYVGKERTLTRKLREVRVAYRLEQTLGKKKVLENYLNTVYLGSGAYGVEAAARTYFRKSASALNVSESALLAGLIPSPVRYSPYTNPKTSEVRRLWVISRMHKLGYIDAAQAKWARTNRPVLVAEGKQSPRFGWFLDAVRSYLVGRYGEEKVFSGGLKVYTTLDPQAQEGAEDDLATALPKASDPHAALVSIDPDTGYVRALVGGRNYGEEQFNIALQGRRQPGSSFKPFVLVAALEKGITPEAGYRGPATVCLKGWKPTCRVSNFDRAGYGGLTLERATINSVNTVYAQLILQVGPKRVVDVARRMGIPGPKWMPSQSGCRPGRREDCRTKIQAVPALALGAEEVTPLEMASAFATLASGGIYREPKLVSKVVDGSGKVLEEGPSPPRRAIDRSVAETTTHILEQVITKGTGKRADFGRPAAGKTGTAQGFRNAWFAGYTKNLATAVWTGYRDTNRSMLNVQGVPRVTGGSIPAEIWREYMRVVIDREPPSAALDSGPKNGAPTNESMPVFEGTAGDSDGVVQRVEVSVDGKPFSTDGVTCQGCAGDEAKWTYSPTTPLPDGPHEFVFRSVDRANHFSSHIVRKVTVDTVAPRLVKVGATGGRSVLELSFSEPVSCSNLVASGFTVALQGSSVSPATVACSGPLNEVVRMTLPRPVRGGDAVQVRPSGSSRGASDPAGNKAASVMRSVLATNAEPTVAISSAAGMEAVRADGVEVAGSAADPDGTVDGVEVSVDNGPFSSQGITCRGCGNETRVVWSYKSTDPLPHGRHELNFRSVDNAASRSPISTQAVTVDAVPPTIETVAAVGGTPRLKTTFSEPMSCSNLNASSITASVDGARASPVLIWCDGRSNAEVEITLSRSVRGGDDVQVRVDGRSAVPTDVVGNPASGIRSTVAKNAAPSVALKPTTLLGHVGPDGREISGSAADPDGDVERVEISLDGRPFSDLWVQCPGCGRAPDATWTYEPKVPLSHGPHRLEVRSVDNAGGYSVPVSQELTVDSVAPRMESMSAGPGKSTVTLGFSEPLACPSVNRSHFQASVDGQPGSVYAAWCEGSSDNTIELMLSPAPAAGHSVVITVRGPSGRAPWLTDLAGNSTAASRVSTIAGNGSYRWGPRPMTLW
jgi:penicillin-binding protein 1A